MTTDLDLRRIADALERIADTLEAIKEDDSKRHGAIIHGLTTLEQPKWVIYEE